MKRQFWLCVCVCGGAALYASFASGAEREPLVQDAPGRQPRVFEGRELVPDLGCFWSYVPSDEKFIGFLDAVAPSNAFDALTLTTRGLTTIVDNREAVLRTKSALEYAKRRYGVGALLDLDLRIARYDFEKRRPDLRQERLFFQEAKVGDSVGTLELNFVAPVLTDHYTGNLPYYVRGSRVAKAWAFQTDSQGDAIPESIVDVSDLARTDPEICDVENIEGAGVDSTVRDHRLVSFDRAAVAAKGTRLAVAVAFCYSYPDLFADETLELEKSIYESWRDAPALGVAKDEWGFPPNFNRVDSLDDFWYSERMRDAYRRECGTDLLDDLFLAFRPQSGNASRRIGVVDAYHKLCSARVDEYETQNYDAAKEIWGRDAFVGVHNTWFPFPNALEMRKNGLLWWRVKRDVAQTDEYVPFCVRNALAKGTGTLWINMFYARMPENYIWEHWTSAASGGRVHLHALYPRGDDSPKNPRDSALLPIVEDADVAKIREKIRMLNFVSNSQIDAPVAVIFSRFGAANPLREEYLAVGVDVCDRFARRGYPADLIPIDEIFSTRANGERKWTLRDGALAYGDQRYRDVIFYGESDAERDAYAAFRALAATCEDCKTRFESLSSRASNEEKDAFVDRLVARFESENVLKQTPWIDDAFVFSVPEERSSRPPRASISRFLDGTILWIAAEQSDFGDPIVLRDEVVELPSGASSPLISVEANGVFAVRFDERGELLGLVATGLKSFRIGDFGATLDASELADGEIDAALIRDEKGEWRGVFQRAINDLPESLAPLAKRWNFLEASARASR